MRVPMGKSCGSVPGTRARTAMPAGTGGRCRWVRGSLPAAAAAWRRTAMSTRHGTFSGAGSRRPFWKSVRRTVPARPGTFLHHVPPGCRGRTRSGPRPTDGWSRVQNAKTNPAIIAGRGNAHRARRRCQAFPREGIRPASGLVVLRIAQSGVSMYPDPRTVCR